MRIFNAGIDHQRAPIQIRECFSVSPEELPRRLGELVDGRLIREGVLVSTCQRTEIFAAADEGRLEAALGHCRDFLWRLARERAAGQILNIEEYLHLYTGGEAVRQLFRVICGLESMALGEAQIAGQVRDAFSAAERERRVGAELHRLFQKAFHVNKRVRSETELGVRSVSVSQLAVQLAKERLGGLNERSILLLGAGKMSRLAVAQLLDHGARNLLITNHHDQTSLRLAAEFELRSLPWEERYRALPQMDAVICSTAAPQPVLLYEQTREALSGRDGKPLMIIDISAPRDVDPRVAGLKQVELYCIDELERQARALPQLLQRDQERAAAIIAAEGADFEDWQRGRERRAALADLRVSFQNWRAAELEGLKNRVPGVSREQWNEIENFSNRLMNKYLHPHCARLQHPAQPPSAVAHQSGDAGPAPEGTSQFCPGEAG